jgi:hypothetical protein
MGKGKFSTSQHTLLVEASLPLQHTWSGTQAIIRDEEVKLQQGNCHFSKTIKISQDNNIPIMPSNRLKTIITNIDQCNSNITSHTQIIPTEEYLVNNAPTPGNQETTPENSIETTAESHLLMQTLAGFDRLKYIVIPDEESMAKRSPPRMNKRTEPKCYQQCAKHGRKTARNQCFKQ